MTTPAPNRDPLSDLLAFASYRNPSEWIEDREERERSYEHMLCRALNLGTVVGFVGAGCPWTQGYPTWEQFANKTVGFTLEKFPARTELAPFRKVLDWYKSQQRQCPSEQLMVWIGKCKSILEKDEELFKEYLATQFGGQPPHKPTPHNPYLDLFDLMIHRFVTTNYDLVLEQQLLDRKPLDTKDPALTPRQREGHHTLLRSFSQKTSDFEQLALFALARVRGHEHAVFHCHGRYDQPDSLIAGEADYQKLYLGDEDNSGRAFRQTIELLLESNPLLFVGYGLADDDLLRPLRYLKALDPNLKWRRPLFALIPRFEQLAGSLDAAAQDDAYSRSLTDEARNEALFERYGLQVITFPVSHRDDAARYGEALCSKLKDIKKSWEEDRKEWTEKPKVRGSRLGALQEKTIADNPCATNVPRGRIFSRTVKGEALPISLPAELQRPGLVCLSGPPGSGKSKHLLTALDSQWGCFDRRFYWNAHYGNEFLPAFDDALAFFGAIDKSRSRHENLKRALEDDNKRFLLIIDGCERLLHTNTFTGEVESYSVAFTRLLNDLDPASLRSTVVISGRVLPSQLLRLDAGARRTIEVVRLVTEDLQQWDSFAAVRSEVGLLTALCSLLNSHSYGICLAGHLLEKAGAPRSRLGDLSQELARRSPNRRLHAMVNNFIDASGRADLYGALLERMAQFVGPICESTCDICLESAAIEVKARTHETSAALLDKFGDWDLVFKTPRRDAGGKPCCCVHATARSMLLQPRHGLASDALPDFGISGFTSGRIDAYLDADRRDQVKDLFEKVVKESEQILRMLSGAVNADAKKQQARTAADLCRDAFSLLRNTMAATTVPRWNKGDYDSYIKHLIRMARLVKAVCRAVCDSEPNWSFCEYFDRQLIEDEDAPLHVSELAWLYNEFGLALSAEGQLRDAYSVLEQAYEITRVMEHFQPGGGYRIEVLLNLTHVFMEMGYLREAWRYLERAERFNTRLRDRDVGGRILGFRGLLAYLGGNLPEASDRYEECARRLAEGNNLRARSVFHKHHADLAMTMGEHAKAELLIRESRALAEAGVFPDLVAFARVSQGHLHVDRGEFKEARREYESLFEEARRVGTRKLEAECQYTLSMLCLQEGDLEGARWRAMRALSLANELALGLRLTHSMIVLGQATVKTGQRDLGVAYLRNAAHIAAEQEYWHCSWKAQNALGEIGVRV